MMIQTKYCGDVECPEDAVIHFPRGLPGFEGLRAFVCLERADTRPLVYLQSLEHPELCFLTLPVASIDSHHRVHLSPEELEDLGACDTERDLTCLAIVAITDAGPTANLLAPVVIDHSRRRGLQAIQYDSDYSHCHPLTCRSETASCW
jgi:flagellar assembly factor FliW